MKELEIIYNICDINNLKIFCDYIFFYSDKIKKLKEIIHENTDNILYMEMNRETFGIFSQDNIIYDLLPHDISILKYIFEDKIVINHVDKIMNESLFIKSIINFNINNIPGIINISWLNEKKVRKIKIFCKDKIIEYNDIYDNIIVFNYHLKVNKFDIEQVKNITEEIVNTHKEEPLRSSIMSALNMIMYNNNEIFIENRMISESVIECFEKIV
jgi:predicted dehydrogenase